MPLDTQPDAQAVVACARKYVGVPWQHQGRLGQVGLDCAGLVIAVAHDLGLSTFERRAYSRWPDSQELRTILTAELCPIRLADVSPGDILLLASGRFVDHLALVGESPTSGCLTLIHAAACYRKVVEHRFAPPWSGMVRGCYRFPGIAAP